MEADETVAGATGASEPRWRERIRDQQASGQSVKVFCAARGLATSTFFAWQRKLLGGRSPRQPGTRQPERFVELIAPRGDIPVGRLGQGDGQEPPHAASSATAGAAITDAPASAGAGAVIELELREQGRPVLLLRHGFDPMLLRQVLEALAKASS